MAIPVKSVLSPTLPCSPFATKPGPQCRRPPRNLLVLCILLLVSAVSVAAQQSLSLADADLRGQRIFQQSAVTGMVLVVVRNREVMVKTYGETAPASGHNPDASSLIRLCSISKVLTSDVLLKLVDRKSTRLNSSH